MITILVFQCLLYLFKTIQKYNSTLKNTIKMTSFHLPHIHGTIRAPYDDEIVKRAPLDGSYRKQMSGSQTYTLPLCQTQQCYRMIWCDWTYTFLYAILKLKIINGWISKNEAVTLTLQLLGGTKSWVISPACTQNLCRSVPEYKSHKQTAKSTPPETKKFLSYLECWLWG